MGEIGGLFTTFTTVIYIVLNLLIFYEWQNSIINSVNEEDENLSEIQKKERRQLMIKRVSYRGVYKLHDTVNSIHQSLYQKVLEENCKLTETNTHLKDEVKRVESYMKT